MKLKFAIYNLLVAGLLLTAGISCDTDDDDDGAPGSIGDITLDLVAEGLESPLGVIAPPDNTGRLFIVDQGGIIYIIKDGERLSQPFLNISSKVIQRQTPQDERGLLGLAFHPEFESNGRFFVFYIGPLSPTCPPGWDHTN
jgi:hypothetical protein